MLFKAIKRDPNAIPVLSATDPSLETAASNLSHDASPLEYSLEDTFLTDLAQYRKRLAHCAPPLIRVACPHYLTIPVISDNAPLAHANEISFEDENPEIQAINESMDEMELLFKDFETLHKSPSLECVNRFYKFVVRQRTTLFSWKIAAEMFQILKDDGLIKPMQFIAFKTLFTLGTPRCLLFTHEFPKSITFDPNDTFPLDPPSASSIVTYLSTLVQAVDDSSVDLFISSDLQIPFGQALANNLMNMPENFPQEKAKKSALLLRCGLQDRFPKMIRAMEETLTNMSTNAITLSNTKRKRLDTCLKALHSPLISQFSEQWYCDPASLSPAHRWKSKKL